MNTEKPPKVVVIERSLSCFYCGVLGLIPVLGLPLVIRSLQQYWRVKRDPSGLWNPAKRYLKWGIICARIGLVVFVILITSIVLVVFFDSVFTSGSQ